MLYNTLHFIIKTKEYYIKRSVNIVRDIDDIKLTSKIEYTSPLFLYVTQAYSYKLEATYVKKMK